MNESNVSVCSFYLISYVFHILNNFDHLIINLIGVSLRSLVIKGQVIPGLSLVPFIHSQMAHISDSNFFC